MFSRGGAAPYLFLFPYLVVFLAFRLGPSLAGLGASFTTWHIVGAAKWVGFDNYKALFHDRLFWTALKNTLYFLVLSAPVQVLLALALALLLNQKLRGRAVVRTIVFAPYAVMSTVVGVIWNWMYDSNFGLINDWLVGFGLPRIQWLTSEGTAMPAIAIATIWWLVGFNMVLFLAGLQDIPEELYEAARIDGAGGWQIIRYITWPLLLPTTFVVVMLTIITAFQVFDQVYVMTGGGPINATLTMVQYLYVQGFEQFNLGYASAIGVIVFLVLIGFAWLQFRTMRGVV